MSQVASDNLPRAETASRLRGPILAAVPILALLVILFWDFLSRQVRWAVQEQADWGHTIAVPFIALYFVYLCRGKILEKRFKTTWVGFIPVIVGVGLYTLCTLGPQPLLHHNTRGFAVWLTIFGLVLLFCGFRAMTWLWFPLVYLLVFGQTISYRLMERVTFEMQDITAQGANVLLMVIGVDVEREGNTIYLYDQGVKKPLNIAEACSGMRMLMAFLALGVFMAYTGLQRTWQQVLVVLMGVPTAIFVNILRVVSLGLLALIDSSLAAGDFHSFIGLVWLLPAFLIYLGIIWIVRSVVTDAPPERAAA